MSAGLSDFHVRAPTDAPCCITLLGEQRVNGVTSRATRVLEFTLALTLAGGEARCSALVRHLYTGCASRSALATVAYRARALGVRTEHVAVRDSYRLIDPVVIDVAEVLTRLQRDDVRGALWLYGGPCLAQSTSPLAVQTRQTIEDGLVRGVLASGDGMLVKQARHLLDDPRLLPAPDATGGLADVILHGSLQRAGGSSW